MNESLRQVHLELDRKFNEFNASMIAVIHDLDDLRKDSSLHHDEKKRKYVLLRERAIRLYNETDGSIRTFEAVNDAKASESPVHFVESCAGILESIPEVFRMLDVTAQAVGLDPATLRPSTTFCSTMQRVVRKQLPTIAASLRSKVDAAGCPTYGFDHDPTEAPLRRVEGIHVSDTVTTSASTFEMKNASAEVANTYLKNRGVAVTTSQGAARGIQGEKELQRASNVLAAPGPSWLGRFTAGLFGTLAGKLVLVGATALLAWLGFTKFSISADVKLNPSTPSVSQPGSTVP